MDPALEESALMSGASLPRILWRVTMQLASPATAAALLILFVRALESFEVPALLGLPAGIEVFTSAIYDAIHALSERNRARLRLWRGAARHHLAVRLPAICASSAAAAAMPR